MMRITHAPFHSLWQQCSGIPAMIRPLQWQFAPVTRQAPPTSVRRRSPGMNSDLAGREVTQS